MRLQDKIMQEHPTRFIFGRGSVSQEEVEPAGSGSTESEDAA
jgi:hypothetical protein